MLKMKLIFQYKKKKENCQRFLKFKKNKIITTKARSQLARGEDRANLIRLRRSHLNLNRNLSKLHNKLLKALIA